MDHLGFVALLIAAILLSFAFSYLQHRAYSRTVRAVAVAHDQSGVVVVSGRGKGFLRGCVVILAVDTTTRRILEARTMQGSTVLARFRRAEFLEGPLKAAPSRATSRWMEEALQQATTQYRETARSARRSRPVATTPKGSAA